MPFSRTRTTTLRRSTGIVVMILGILVLSGCVSTAPEPTCDPVIPLSGEVDAEHPRVRWLDVMVPVPFSMQDDDLGLQATWTFAEEGFSEIRKLEYYGLTRSGYMGGPGSMMLGPGGIRSNVVTVELPTVSSVHDAARSSNIEDPVLHVFVMFSGGEPTMTLQGHWNGTDLSYAFGGDASHTLRSGDFGTTSDDPTLVSASLPIPNPNRTVALAWFAEETAGLLWRSPSYERPDGSTQAMKIPFLAEFSELSGTWRFTMKAGDLSDPESTIVWGTLFNPAQASAPEC